MKKVYLERMGIIDWQLRDNNKSTADFFYCQIKDTLGKVVGVIVADISSDIWVNEQENLLKKIAEALSPHYVFVHDISIESNDQFAILLGNNSCKQYATLCNTVIQAHSLAELIQTVAYKKALWAEIKTLTTGVRRHL